MSGRPPVSSSTTARGGFDGGGTPEGGGRIGGKVHVTGPIDVALAAARAKGSVRANA